MQTPPPYPASRPRRLRRDAFTRELVREHRLHTSDLILPVFVLAGQGVVQDVASMPGVQRLSLDRLLPVAEDCVKLGIPVMALFPVIDQALKFEDGREALNPEGLVPTVVRELKKRFPQLGLMFLGILGILMWPLIQAIITLAAFLFGLDPIKLLALIQIVLN